MRMVAFLRFGFLKVVFGVWVEVVVEVCLSSRTRAPTSVQSIVTAWKPQFKELGKVMPERRRPEKTET